MNWSSTADFVAMGGYGLYVWGAFGMTALVMAAEMLALRARRRSLRASNRMSFDRVDRDDDSRTDVESENHADHVVDYSQARLADYQRAPHEAES